MRGGISQFSVEIFISHSTKKIRWGTLRFIRKYWVAKNYTHKKGIALNFNEKTLPHNADNFRRRTLLYFERILVSKFFKQRRGEASRFCRKLCVLLYRNISLVNTLVYQKVSGTKRFVHHTGGYHLFPSKTLCHTGPKNSLGAFRCFRKFRVSQKFMNKKGISLNSVEKISLTVPIKS